METNRRFKNATQWDLLRLPIFLRIQGLNKLFHFLGEFLCRFVYPAGIVEKAEIGTRQTWNENSTLAKFKNIKS